MCPVAKNTAPPPPPDSPHTLTHTRTHAGHVVLVDVLRATPTAKTICGYVLPRTFLLRTHTYFSIMTQKRNVYPHADIQGVILRKWKPDVDSLPAWRIGETNGYALGSVGGCFWNKYFSSRTTEQHPPDMLCVFFLFFPFPLPTFLHQIPHPRNICRCISFFFLLLLQSCYSKRGRSLPSSWVLLGDTRRPSASLFVPGLLRAPGPVPSRMTNGLNEIGQLSIHA